MLSKMRVEVLFDQEQFSDLERIARRDMPSAGKLTRETMTLVYHTADTEKRRYAVH